MPIATTTNRVQYNGDGSSLDFAFTFGVFESGDLTVILTSAAGVDTTLVEGTHYDITLTAPASLPSAGQVEMVTAPASGETLTIIRELDYTQEVEITNGGPLPADSINEANDRAVMLLQQIKEIINRSLTLPQSSSVSGLQLPAPEALYFLRWNAAADALENLDLNTIGAIAISVLGKALIDDETAADMLTTLGLDTDLLTLSLPASTTISAFAKTLLDDADASTVRATIGCVSDTAYASSWDGVTDIAPSKNAVYDKFESLVSVPVGTVIACPVSTVPTGFLECNGAAISKTTYAALYTVLKDGGAAGIYGESTTFNLPDYRGRFMRGWDHGVGRDPDRASRTNRGDTTTGDYVGTNEADDYKAHVHIIRLAGASSGVQRVAVTNNDGYGNYSSETAPTSGGNETRPVNINVMYIIKY